MSDVTRSGAHIIKVTDIPICEHWAILDTRAIYIPGDERSRTHPGHGYPATTEHTISYQVFHDYELFIAELQTRSNSAVGIHVTDVYGLVQRVEVKNRTIRE